MRITTVPLAMARGSVIALTAGLALGMVGRLSDFLDGVARLAFVMGSPWVVTAVLVGAIGTAWRDAARDGALALVSVAIYYATMRLSRPA